MARIPLWRKFEDASISERCALLGGCDWRFCISTPEGELWSVITQPNDTKEQAKENHKNWLINLIDRLKEDIKKYELDERDRSSIIAKRYESIERNKARLILLESKDTQFRWKKQMRHNSKYRSVASSFYQSKEWKNFRLSWLEKHPVCSECGEIKETMQVHHKDKFGVFHTALTEGFLEPLKDTNRFSSLCLRCHQKKSGSLIIATREQVERWPQYHNAKKKAIVEIQPPEGYTGVIRISFRDLYALSLDERKKLMENEGWV